MDDIFARFPEMKPISGPPSLQTVNGIGSMAYGARDHDAETGTYVKTLWFTFVFIPLIPLAAYRVADAPGGGWYFIGKVPLMRGLFLWPLSLVVIAAGLIGYFSWSSYTKTPAYQAGQKLAQADRLRQQGNLADAARLYREVAAGKGGQSARAVQAINDMLTSPDLRDKVKPVEAAGVLRVAWNLRDQPNIVKDVVERGMDLANAHSDADPAGSLALLEAIEPGAGKVEDFLPAKTRLLERLHREQPNNLDWTIRLAVVYEQTNQRPRCQKLLEPLAKSLGNSEGARILGQVYQEQGKLDEALALLQPYVDAHVQGLSQAQAQYRARALAVQERVLKSLKEGKASDFDFARFEGAGKQQKQEMVQTYMLRHIQEDSELSGLEETVRREQVVIHAVLDLGMLHMARAQRMPRPEERTQELERAEKTFLSIQGVAGESSQYRLSLGQVYYWLGKQAEGRKLFEEVLEADGRSVDTLLLAGRLLRNLGATAEARKLFEEVYNKAGAERAQQQEGALMRALSFKDLDDRITWLERANPDDSQVKADLAIARGRKALEEGKEDAAAAFFRQAVAIYAAQPETAATLNNGALASQDLYRTSGERAALERSTEMMEKALTLSPSDAILVGNVADAVLASGLAEVIGARIDLGKLRRLAGTGDLSFLYQDDAGRQVLVQQIKDNARISKARALFDRALILAPNNSHLYSDYKALLSFLDDREGLGKLVRRAAEASFDQATVLEKMKERWEGKNDEQDRRSAAVEVARAERLVEATRPSRLLEAARPVDRATFALAVAELLSDRLKQESLGVAFDGDALVKLAEEAHQMAPSAGTNNLLQLALLLRASKALAAQEPEYAAMASKGRRLLDSTHQVAVALWREGKPRTAALANADVKRAQELLLESLSRLPDQVSDWSWIMLRAAHPDEAARLAEKLKTSERLRLENDLEGKLYPPYPVRALRQCWALEAAGKPAEGLAVLRASAHAGVPLPFDVPQGP
jgi:tetratricopeptide (TPR) repeat protein